MLNGHFKHGLQKFLNGCSLISLCADAPFLLDVYYRITTSSSPKNQVCETLKDLQCLRLDFFFLYSLTALGSMDLSVGGRTFFIVFTRTVPSALTAFALAYIADVFAIRDEDGRAVVFLVGSDWLTALLITSPDSGPHVPD